MKVQTSDDAKLNNGDEKPCDVSSTCRSSTSGPYTIDYEIKPSPQAKYVNLSKLVLLILAIIATFLACLIFARDLWGQKNVEKPELLRHHAPRIMAPSSQLRFPFDDFLDEMNDPFDFPGKDEGAKSEDDPHLVKTAKITFKYMPKDGEEFPGAPFGMKKIGFGGPDMDDGIFGDILKTIMDLANRPEERRQPSFGDLPFFDGPNNPRPMHPKLIIFKKIPSGQPQDDDVIKNLLTDLNSPVIRPADKYKRPVEPFPLFPMIRPMQRMDDSPSDALISRIIKDFGVGGPLGRIVIKNKPLPPPNTDAELSWPEGWKQYKTLVSKLAEDIDLILDSTSTLKQTVTDELSKIKDETPEVPTDGSDAPKPENPSKDFLSSALESLNKIGVALTEGSIVIKTEDGAMDLVNKSDKKSLANTVDTFLKELNGPLAEIFSTSTALTKMAGKDGVSQPVLQGIVSVASKIVDFGKIIYEDISKLASTALPSLTIPSLPQPVAELKSNLEPVLPSNDAPGGEPEKKIVFFNAEPAIESAQPEESRK